MSFKEILEDACFDIGAGERIARWNYWLFYLGAFDWIYVLFSWISEGRIYLVSAYIDLWNYAFVGLPPGMKLLGFVAAISYYISFFLALNLFVTVWRVVRIIGVMHNRRTEQ
jgi:hypothetical protein